MAFDYKKEYKEFYMPKNKPGIIEIPKMNYIAVRGKGNPNEENGEYKNSIGLLYGIAFTIKMSYKGTHKIEGFFEYVVPPEIDKIPAAREQFIRAMEDDQRTYEALTAALMEGYVKELLAQGVPEKQARSKAEKHAIEDARYVLPNACTTRIVMTANARSLRNFFRLRCCNRAQWEIRALAEEMYKLVYAVAPTLFGHSGPACVDGVCTEGKMSCGRAAEVRAHYQALRKAARE